MHFCKKATRDRTVRTWDPAGKLNLHCNTGDLMQIDFIPEDQVRDPTCVGIKKGSSWLPLSYGLLVYFLFLFFFFSSNAMCFSTLSRIAIKKGTSHSSRSYSLTSSYALLATAITLSFLTISSSMVSDS